jgi:hypothetical protein
VYQVPFDWYELISFPFSPVVAWTLALEEFSGEAVAGAAPKERPDTMVAAASPAAPMDLRAKEALFL